MKNRFLNLVYCFRKRVVGIVLLLLTSSFIFLFGSTLESTYCQNCGQYLANLSKNTGCSSVVSVYDSKETTARFFSDHYYGFDLFHTGNNVFAGYNADKSKKASLSFGDKIISEDYFNNLTLVTTRGLNVEKNKDGKNRNSYYDFDLMFSSIGKIDGYSTSCFVTKTQADKLLVLSGKTSYEKLIGEKVVFNCEDRKPLELTIFNIILEENQEFERFTNSFGYFFVANDWEFLRSPFLSMYYFMNKDNFENYEYLKMIKEAYSESSIVGEVINAKSSSIEINSAKTLLDMHLKKEKGLDAPSTTFLMLSIAFFVGSLICIIKSKETLKLVDAFFYLAVPLLPYLIFRLISFISKSQTFFSYYSTVGLLIIELALFIVLCILLHLKSKKYYENDR